MWEEEKRRREVRKYVKLNFVCQTDSKNKVQR